MPRALQKRLALRGRIKWTEDRRTWSVQYIPGKRFQVTCSAWRSGFVIRDAAVWYGSGLDAASQKWLGKRKLPVPRRWLEDFRRAFAEDFRRAVLYCRRDAHLAARLHRRVCRGFEALGVDVSRVASPAGAAGQLWRDALASGSRVPREVSSAFEAGYFGGRFETLRLGRVRRAVYWDIRSAYPWAFSTLPDATGALWRECFDDRETLRAARAGRAYVVAECDVVVPLELRAGPVPVRDRDGLVIFPVGAWRGTYTAPDLRSLLACGARVTVRRALIGDPVTRRPAFPGIARLFQKRIEAERAGDKDTSLAIKLTLNGLYGKTAERREAYRDVRSLGAAMRSGEQILATRESIVTRKRWPARTASFVYAATATALVRERLWRDLPWGRVVFVATDGALLSRGARPARMRGNKLGRWKLDGGGLSGWTVGNGWYFLGAGRRELTDERAHARGYGRLTKTKFGRLLAAMKPGARVLTMPARLENTSLAQTVRGSVEDLNVLQEVEPRIFLDADTKRVWRAPRTAGRMRRRTIYSDPIVWLDRTVIDPRPLVRRLRR